MRLEVKKTNRLSETDLEFFASDELKKAFAANKVCVQLSEPMLYADLTEMIEWCSEHLKGQWFSPVCVLHEYYMNRAYHHSSGISTGVSDYVRQFDIYFEEESDKVAFKVRWNGDNDAS